MSDEFSDNGFQDMAEALMNQGQVSTVPARFFADAVLDEAKSTELGKPHFVDVAMIEIRLGKDIIRRPANDEDKKKYARLWKAYEAGQSQDKVEGTPLHEWPLMTRAEAENLKSAGIRTVESFAECPDTVLQELGPYMAKRQVARDWLRKARGEAVLSQLNARLASLEAENTTLRQMLETQRADIAAARNNGGVLVSAPVNDGAMAVLAEVRRQMAELQAQVNAPKRRGRPPKNANGTA